MSTTRFFQRIRSSSVLNQFNNNYNVFQSNHHLSNKSLKSLKLNRIGKTTTLISSGLILGWSIQSYYNISENNCLAEIINGHNNNVYTWGFNRYGQLGVGSESNENLPKQIPGLEDIVFVSCGAEQTAAITSDGKVYTFGRGQDARLGHGSTSGSNETYPRLVEELADKKVKYIDAGYNHMACVTEDGQVWTWGKNTYNQLGHTKSSYPNVVESLLDDGIKAAKVACGRYHTVVLTDDGKCFSWGGFKSGETGTGKKRNCPSPTQVSSLGNKKIIDVAAGQDFTLFLSEDGTLYACGAGDQGQTGQGSSSERFHVTPTKVPAIKNVNKIAAGQFHSIISTTDGDVYTFGLNREGQLGHGDTQNRTLPTQIDSLVNDSNLKVIDVAAGGGHSACIVHDEKLNKNQLYIFGRGRQGQIGRANNIESVAAYRALPVIVDFFDGLKGNIGLVDLGANHSAVLCQQI